MVSSSSSRVKCLSYAPFPLCSKISSGTVFTPGHLVFPGGDKTRSSHLQGNQYRGKVPNGYLGTIPTHVDDQSNNTPDHQNTVRYYSPRRQDHQTRGDNSGESSSNSRRVSFKDSERFNNFFKFFNVQTANDLDEYPEPDYSSEYSEQSDGDRSDPEVKVISGPGERIKEDAQTDGSSKGRSVRYISLTKVCKVTNFHRSSLIMTIIFTPKPSKSDADYNCYKIREGIIRCFQNIYNINDNYAKLQRFALFSFPE